MCQYPIYPYCGTQ